MALIKDTKNDKQRSNEFKERSNKKRARELEERVPYIETTQKKVTIFHSTTKKNLTNQSI